LIEYSSINQYNNFLTDTVSDAGYLLVVPGNNLETSITAYNFGDIFLSEKASVYITIKNTGENLLVIDSLNTALPEFKSQDSLYILKENDSINIMVEFIPTTEQSYVDNLMIYSNDSDEPIKQVLLQAKGISIPPSIEVISPNGSEVWVVNEQKDITWNNETVIDSVKIEYSIDNGSTWKTIIDRTINDSIHEWKIPNDVSSQCKVKISSLSDPSIYDENDTEFIIQAYPKITVWGRRIVF
jgi:hypothetical protein